ncbi:MAG: MG2 domain-containing protein [Pirellulaceae bacterium]
MSHVKLMWVFALAFSTLFGWAMSPQTARADDPALRAEANKLFNDGNFREAYDQFRKLCEDPRTDGRLVAEDLQRAFNCLQRLGETEKLDELIETTVEAHAGSWRLLVAAGNLYRYTEHYGYIIGNEFVRGWRRQEGRPVNVFQRDRVRGLQLLNQARELIGDENDKAAVAGFYQTLADALMADRQYGQSWQLQELTDLDTLPDYLDGHWWDAGSRGAPVDADGNPVVHAEPETWDAAKSDGERWRFCLAASVENEPRRMSSVRMQIASFAMSQFGVQTMQQFSWFRGFGSDDGDRPRTFDLDTLTDEETLARLANGVQRFELPAEYNHVKIYRAVADLQNDDQAENALTQLASVYENRRQYEKAAAVWREAIERFGPGGPGKWREQRLNQIVGMWGTVEPVRTLPAGVRPSFPFKFRNATRVNFTATPLDIEKVLTDVKNYLKGNPQQLEWNRLQIDNIGYNIVNEGLDKYRKEGVIEWAEDLEPRRGHYDRRIMITAPEMPAGAYLVESNVAGGNSSRFILWVADSVLVRKQIDGGILYFAADAMTGTPMARANMEFFGYRGERDQPGNRVRILTSNFALRADENGLVVPESRDLSNEYQWMTVVRDDAGRMAFLGFNSVWTSERFEQDYNSVKSFVITDRPIYRPNQALQFKVWVGRTQYDQDGPSPFKDQTIPITIRDPEGTEVFTASPMADEFGGVVGTFEIPETAKLGQYYIQVGLGNEFGGNTFRVEEYKKPEFEVTVDAPEKPVMLGEKVPVTIRARYYFGAPVTEATVAYKIMRSEHRQNWYPYAPWDWCFGPGYWWFGYDYDWYPGYRSWVGCMRPAPWWIWSPPGPPPEIVAQDEVKIGPDGTVTIEVDSAIAAALMSDTDHKYSVTAEVRDASRRTIVGSGEIIAARQPFRVFTWVERGYFRVGSEANAFIQAQTADGKPVSGRGEWILNKIDYDADRQPIETVVKTWPLEANEEGHAELRFDASSAGQYRLVAKVTDDAGHTIEGAYVFTIIGDGFTGRDYRFNALELVPERREYAPGDRVSLQINTDQEDSTVLFFLRPSNGVCLPPKVIRLNGRSAVEVFDIVKRDMPNMFVEAVTVSNGAVYTEARELFIPPEEPCSISTSSQPPSDTSRARRRASRYR